MSYEHRQEKEVVLTQGIDDFIAQANASDAIDDAIYLSIRGDELPSTLQTTTFKERLKTVRAVSGALEARKLANNPGQTVDNFDAKAQISFADFEPVSWVRADNSITVTIVNMCYEFPSNHC